MNGITEVTKSIQKDDPSEEETAKNDKGLNEQAKSESKTPDEAKEELPIEKIFDSGSEVAKSLGNFKLYKSRGMYFSGTIIDHEEHIIISGYEGSILFYSIEHGKTYIFKGAGGTLCN